MVRFAFQATFRQLGGRSGEDQGRTPCPETETRPVCTVPGLVGKDGPGNLRAAPGRRGCPKVTGGVCITQWHHCPRDAKALRQCPTKGFGPPRIGGFEQEGPRKQNEQSLGRGRQAACWVEGGGVRSEPGLASLLPSHILIREPGTTRWPLPCFENERHHEMWAMVTLGQR